MSKIVHATVLALASVLVPPTPVLKAHSTAVKAPVVTTTTTTTLVSANDMAEWQRVAWCETHANWKHQGWLYEGGLGILHSNWAYYGGYKYAPHAWLATPEQQVSIAIKIQHGLPVPDAYGCSPW